MLRTSSEESRAWNEVLGQRISENRRRVIRPVMLSTHRGRFGCLFPARGHHENVTRVVGDGVPVASDVTRTSQRARPERSATSDLLHGGLEAVEQ